MRPARFAVFLAIGLAVALGLAFFVSPFANPDPDGLVRVAIDRGFAGNERTHAVADGPLADYSVSGVDGGLSTGLAGVIGVALCFAIGAAAVWALRRVKR